MGNNSNHREVGGKMADKALTPRTRILLVLRSPDLFKSLSRLLALDNEVICRDSPMAAALALEEGGFDAVLSDINFGDPWLDGVGLLDCIRQSKPVLSKQKPNIKFAIMSGGNPPEGLLPGIFFLQRPFSPEKVKQILQE